MKTYKLIFADGFEDLVSVKATDLAEAAKKAMEVAANEGRTLRGVVEIEL